MTLENIRQIPGMQSIVTAVYDVPVGEVWSRESIAKLKKQVEDAGLGFDVIESIPVHEIPLFPSLARPVHGSRFRLLRPEYL